MTAETGQILIDSNVLTTTNYWPLPSSLTFEYTYNSTAQFTDPCPSNCNGVTMGNPTCYGGIVSSSYTPTNPPVPPNPTSYGIFTSFSSFFILITLWMVFQ